MLSKYKFWRRFKGGLWWLVALPSYIVVGLSPRWINRVPFEFEEVLDAEDYTAVYKGVLEEGEFINRVINAAPSSMWRHPDNVKSFVNDALILKKRGIDEATIFSIMDRTYKVCFNEGSNGSKLIEYDYRVMRENVSPH